jgi:inosine-uridine nucleoside N-ribohydrolase
MSRRSLWIDTDVALGATRGDVDDGFALAALVRAVRAPGCEWTLAGVSAVAGNTDAATAAACARALLAALGASVPVFEQSQAASALAGLPTGASLVALGPLTNVAAALAEDPTLTARIELRIVGSVLRPWRHPVYRLSDLNLRRDGAAARRVLAAPLQRRLFPLDVVQALRIGGPDLERLAAGGPAGAYLAQHSQRWLRRSRLRNLGRGFPAWDLVPALDAVGRLPGARFEGDRLVGFDVPGARDELFALLAGDRATIPT